MARCSECGSATKKYGTAVRTIACLKEGQPHNVQLRVKRIRCLDSVCKNIDYIYPKDYEKSPLGMYTTDYVEHVKKLYEETTKTPYMVAVHIGKSYGTVKRILGITK